jgi:hypothetical protein
VGTRERYEALWAEDEQVIDDGLRQLADLDYRVRHGWVWYGLAQSLVVASESVRRAHVRRLESSLEFGGGDGVVQKGRVRGGRCASLTV